MTAFGESRLRSAALTSQDQKYFRGSISAKGHEDTIINLPAV